MQMSLIGSKAGALLGQDDAPEGDFMQVMARTMSQMTRRGRYFVNMTQWAAAWWQYVLVATAYKHFNLGDASAYINMICAMAEPVRVKGELDIKAVVYDEVFRKYMRQQAQKGDPNLDIVKEMREVNEALAEAVQIRLCTVVRNIPGANNGFGVQPSVAASPASAGFDDQAIQKQFNQQATVSEALRTKAEQATKTRLQDAKTQENQIRGVMDARANGGVRLVEGPGGKKKEWEAVPSVDAKGMPLSNTKRRTLHFLGKVDAKRGGKSIKR